MELSKDDIKEFKKIYKKDTGKDISNEKAQELALNLILMFKNVYKPIKSKKEGKIFSSATNESNNIDSI